jgi:hypothetical protein
MSFNFNEIQIALEMLNEKLPTIHLQKTRRECKRVLMALNKVVLDYKKELNQMINTQKQIHPSYKKKEK